MNSERGFTLIESVIIMVVIAILAAAILLRGNPFDRIKLDNSAKKIASDIRYAQKLAVSAMYNAGVAFNADGYSVYQNVIASTLANSPGDPCSTDANGKFVVDFNQPRCGEYQNVTLSITNAPGGTVAFTPMGAPIDTAGNPLDTSILTVTYNGSRSITINKGTGKVEY